MPTDTAARLEPNLQSAGVEQAPGRDAPGRGRQRRVDSMLRTRCVLTGESGSGRRVLARGRREPRRSASRGRSAPDRDALPRRCDRGRAPRGSHRPGGVDACTSLRGCKRGGLHCDRTVQTVLVRAQVVEAASGASPAPVTRCCSLHANTSERGLRPRCGSCCERLGLGLTWDVGGAPIAPARSKPLRGDADLAANAARSGRLIGRPSDPGTK
jgi:hypothetical protein